MVFSLWLGLERYGQRNLVDAFLEPRIVDRTKAIGANLGRDDIVADRHAQALELDLFLGAVFALEHAQSTAAAGFLIVSLRPLQAAPQERP